MSTTDQVTLLCQDIEDSFQSGEKAGTVFLDLTAAYDTVPNPNPTHEAPGNHPRQAHCELHNGDAEQPQLPATHQQRPKQ